MSSTLLINEFMFNPSASGDPNEFIEVKGDANTDYSEWSLIVVDGDGSVAGKIDNVFQLGTTNSSGYWVTPYQKNALQNGTQTVLLVKDFTGKVGDDLDTANTGTFTSTPWSEIGDTIAVSDGGSGDPTYANAPVLTGKLIAGASRIPDGTDTDSASDWTGMTRLWPEFRDMVPLLLPEPFWLLQEPQTTEPPAAALPARMTAPQGQDRIRDQVQVQAPIPAPQLRQP